MKKTSFQVHKKMLNITQKSKNSMQRGNTFFTVFKSNSTLFRSFSTSALKPRKKHMVFLSFKRKG